VQLGGLGLALERPQPRARLALDVERPVEVVLRALELELRAAPALAVLAQPGGLLDQQPAVLGLGGDDRLDAALGDDECISLPRPGVGEDLEHVDHPALRAVEAVLALAVAVQAPEDRDLADRQVDGAVAVVEHELDLGRRARLHAAAAAKMTSCIDWPRTASGDCSPMAHRHGVGHVGLARAVRAHDDRDAGPELQPGAVGNDLKPLRVSDFRCTSALLCEVAAPRARPRPRRRRRRSPCRPARSAPRPARRASSSAPTRGRAPRPHDRHDLERPSCGGPSSAITS
jgi:hypothetical protein